MGQIATSLKGTTSVKLKKNLFFHISLRYPFKNNLLKFHPRRRPETLQQCRAFC